MGVKPSVQPKESSKLAPVMPKEAVTMEYRGEHSMMNLVQGRRNGMRGTGKDTNSVRELMEYKKRGRAEGKNGMITFIPH